MRYTVHKLFWAWEHEKEEKWLDAMSAKGLQLTGIGFCKYTFEEGNKGEYTYRLELLENSPTHAESIAYIRFLEETGVEYVGSIFRWAYFRKKAAEGDFEIYSDIDSKIKHHKRIITLFILLIPINLWGGIANITNFFKSRDISLLGISFISWAVTLLLLTGTFTIGLKVRKLKKEKAFRE